MQTIQYISRLLLCLIIIHIYSCEKFVEVEPTDRVTTVTAFSDSVNATASIIGVYSDLVKDANTLRILNGGVSISTALSGDELYANSAPISETQFFLNAVSPIDNNWNSAYLWKAAYQIIYKANACLEGLKESSGISVSLKIKLTGEMLFLRAFCYFNLVNLYGDVPYITTTNYSENAIKPRVKSSEVISNLIDDLLLAKEMLLNKYPSSGRQRVNKSVVQSLLSKLYMYQDAWAKAESEASEVIARPEYKLSDQLEDVFLPGSSEAIWQIHPVVPGIETAVGAFLIPAGNDIVPTYSISPFLLSAFETGDNRLEKWIGKSVVSENGNLINYYYPYKYKLGRDNWTDNPSESFMYIRLAEIHLIRAEARARLGNISNSGGAIEDVNKIRSRASLPDTFATSNQQALDIIEHEKQVELFTEWGIRWFDLKRIGKIDLVMEIVSKDKKSNWNSNWQLFPVPSVEIQSNTKLTQNDGYAR